MTHLLLAFVGLLLTVGMVVSTVNAGAYVNLVHVARILEVISK